MERRENSVGKSAVIIGALLAVLGVALIALILSIPIVNNRAAERTRDALLRAPLPQGATLVDSLSAAGKLTGNGNGMQYFGAILIESEMTLDELNAYYEPFRAGEWDFRLEEQVGRDIGVIENGNYAFEKVASDNSAYILYSWGDCDYFLRNWDLRAY